MQTLIAMVRVVMATRIVTVMEMTVLFIGLIVTCTFLVTSLSLQALNSRTMNLTSVPHPKH